MGKCMKSEFGEDEIEDYHWTLLVNNKIWLFSKKYKARPSYEWGQWVTYVGGYAMNFDLITQKWSEKLAFDELSDEENMDEVIFTLNAQIYMVLFRKFGSIEFVKCFRWDLEKAAWLPVKLSIHESNKLKSDDPNEACSVFIVDQDSFQTDSLFFASFIDGAITLHELKLKGYDEVMLESSRKLNMDAYDSLLNPVTGARWKNNIYIMSAMHGCGFHFQPSSVLHYECATNKTTVLEIAGEKPPFRFAGSRKTVLLPSGHWIHATGSTAHGMTGHKFCGEIWEINLDSTPLRWHKTAVQVPELQSEEICLAVSDDRHIYAFDHSSDMISSHF